MDIDKTNRGMDILRAMLRRAPHRVLEIFGKVPVLSVHAKIPLHSLLRERLSEEWIASAMFGDAGQQIGRQVAEGIMGNGHFEMMNDGAGGLNLRTSVVVVRSSELLDLLTEAYNAGRRDGSFPPSNPPIHA